MFQYSTTLKEIFAMNQTSAIGAGKLEQNQSDCWEEN
jgi:hypothetical protein